MGIRTALAVFAIVVAPQLAARAHADSDGVYCIGPNYLAYQFGYAAPSPTPHRLFVVSLGIPGVLEKPTAFDLPQFQVHGMVCEAGRIEVAAFDRLYTITLDHRALPQAFSEKLYEKPGAFPWADVASRQRNLGGWSRPVNTLQIERVPLPAPVGTTAVLEISPRPAAERCVTFIKTRVVVSDSTGQVGDLTVFEGIGHRECGGRPVVTDAARRSAPS